MRKRGVCVSACPAGTLSNCSAWASRTHSSPWATLGLFFLSVPLPGFHFVFTATPHNPFIQHPVTHKLPVAPAFHSHQRPPSPACALAISDLHSCFGWVSPATSKQKCLGSEPRPCMGPGLLSTSSVPRCQINKLVFFNGVQVTSYRGP